MTSENPMAAMLPIAQAKIDAITALDDRLVKYDGTMAELSKKATESAVATPMASLTSLVEGGHKKWATDTFSSLIKADTYGDFVNGLDSLVDATREVGLELSTLWIRANRADSDDRAALVSQRDALVTEAEAFILVLRDQKVDGADKLVIPDAPKAPRKGGSSGTKGSSKSLRFYRRNDDGTQTFPSDGQQKASSVAFYQFNANIDAMEAAMRDAGWDGSYTTPWEGKITVSDKKGVKTTTKTIGWEISTPDESTDVTPEDKANYDATLKDGLDAGGDDTDAKGDDQA
jgi:hypothetical protein